MVRVPTTQHRHVHLPHVRAHRLRTERLCAHLHAECKPWLGFPQPSTGTSTCPMSAPTAPAFIVFARNCMRVQASSPSHA